MIIISIIREIELNIEFDRENEERKKNPFNYGQKGYETKWETLKLCIRYGIGFIRALKYFEI